MQVRLHNDGDSTLGLNLSPWSYIGTLEPGASVEIGHGLPDGGYAELDIAETGIFYHGWDGFACRLVFLSGDAHPVRLPAPSQPIYRASRRPPPLVAWATSLGQDFDALLVADARGPGISWTIDDEAFAQKRKNSLHVAIPTRSTFSCTVEPGSLRFSPYGLVVEPR